MESFPGFMRNPKNKISAKTQYGKGIEGYVFDGLDGSQMAFWTCEKDGTSEEHVHDYDEYLAVVQGVYTVIIEGRKIPVGTGQEYFISKNSPHAGEYVKGTRIIQAFGGKRVKREIEN